MRYYYTVFPSGLNLKPLTYHSDFKIPNFTQVLINIKNKKTFGYVLQSVAEPDFKTIEILEILPATLTPIQISLLKFISHYYIVNLSVAAGLFTPLETNANLTDAQACDDKGERKNLNLTTEFDKCNPSNFAVNFDNDGRQNSVMKLDEVCRKNFSAKSSEFSRLNLQENLNDDLPQINFDGKNLAPTFDIYVKPLKMNSKVTANDFLAKNPKPNSDAIAATMDLNKFASDNIFVESSNLNAASQLFFLAFGKAYDASVSEAALIKNLIEISSLNDDAASQSNFPQTIMSPEAFLNQPAGNKKFIKILNLNADSVSPDINFDQTALKIPFGDSVNLANDAISAAINLNDAAADINQTTLSVNFSENANPSDDAVNLNDNDAVLNLAQTSLDALFDECENPNDKVAQKTPNLNSQAVYALANLSGVTLKLVNLNNNAILASRNLNNKTASAAINLNAADKRNLDSGDPCELNFSEPDQSLELNLTAPTLNQTSSDRQGSSEIFPKIPNLNQNQQEALNFAESRKASLIFGDTGSGKSEIYFSLIRKYLLANKQVLLLMPEISLTPQMTKRLKSYFGDKFGVWHSKITPKNRGEILRKFGNREINLIAGARSALFLPFTDLGLIIVDEEHDDSYKSAQNPHYNARDLALFLASKFDVKVVLGSATPSAVSYAKQPYFRLKGTFFQSEKKFIYDESETTGLSDIVLRELGESFENGKQAVVFLPARANFRYLSCRECGSAIKCPFCSVGMSFYKKKNMLKCQYCGFTMPTARECDKCGSEMIEAKKIGTDELAGALALAFPTARIAKFDRDEITTQSKLEKTLAAFNAGEIDALVGTQMLSKGHDYHNVDLAVVMGADELLNFPDFRARERTLALAMQVAGRAGRSGVGRVIVQSKQREFFERFISDYDAFLTDEIAAREPLYPPFARLLRAVVADKNERAARDKLEICVSELENLRASEPALQIVGYGKCAIEILGGKYRFEILLRCVAHPALIKAGRICVRHGFDADIDPINFS